MAKIKRQLKILHLGNKLLMTVSPVSSKEAKDPLRILVEVKEVIQERIAETMAGKSPFVGNMRDKNDG